MRNGKAKLRRLDTKVELSAVVKVEPRQSGQSVSE